MPPGASRTMQRREGLCARRCRQVYKAKGLQKRKGVGVQKWSVAGRPVGCRSDSKVVPAAVTSVGLRKLPTRKRCQPKPCERNVHPKGLTSTAAAKVGGAEESDFEAMSYKAVQQRLMDKGISAKGSKCELVARLCSEPCADTPDIMALTRRDIVQQLKGRGLRSRGRKAALAGVLAAALAHDATPAGAKVGGAEESDFEAMSYKAVQQRLMDKGLSAKGSKCELVARLCSEPCADTPDIMALTRRDIVQQLKGRGLRSRGGKAALAGVLAAALAHDTTPHPTTASCLTRKQKWSHDDSIIDVMRALRHDKMRRVRFCLPLCKVEGWMRRAHLQRLLCRRGLAQEGSVNTLRARLRADLRDGGAVARDTPSPTPSKCAKVHAAPEPACAEEQHCLEATCLSLKKYVVCAEQWQRLAIKRAFCAFPTMQGECSVSQLAVPKC